ncbi:MAG: hypothetical protein ABIR66_10665 [Saprospiraceae bacterium]
MEHKNQPLANSNEYFIRVAKALVFALLILSFALGVGAVGYHHLGHLDWVNSIYNASMILSGMGPADPLPSDEAKLFASGYAIASGIIFIGLIGIVLAPIFHRLMHRFHIEEK